MIEKQIREEEFKYYEAKSSKDDNKDLDGVSDNIKKLKAQLNLLHTMMLQEMLS
jgi:hypothetical protein